MPARAATVLTGTRIRERRLAMARRQADIARAVGISPAYLNLIEHNRRPVGADLIARLAEVLEVPRRAGRRPRGGPHRGPARGRGPSVAVGTVPELDQVTEFLARFPGWSGL
ncbi:helix-turn-helix transcriptional regulator [Paracoccus marcusii]|uniref:helix-turn-helix domain-containing protein n=1 Tax=Paracoccus marcusii TaxID=59779 RepID=UPI002ED63ACF|nr:helix-turn-helix transcriptional regulator [Paracoccus marcusii]